MSAVTPIFLGVIFLAFPVFQAGEEPSAGAGKMKTRETFNRWLEASKTNHLCRDLEPGGEFNNRLLKGFIHLGAQSPGQGRALGFLEERWRWHSQGAALASLLLYLCSGCWSSLGGGN